MTNNQWDDDKLENLLHSMPKIEDNRTKELVLERLKRDHRLKKRQRMQPKKWMPFIVAAAALLIITLIIPSMINNTDRAVEDLDSARELRAEKAIDTSFQNDAVEEAETFSATETKETAVVSFAAVESHVLLAEELIDVTPFQVGLMESANVIPITFLIQESRIRSDFPEGSPTSVELYNNYAAEIPEEELGFSDYHPYKGTIYDENGILHHQIPNDHMYDSSSATVDVYFNSMKETFSDFEKIQLVDEQGNPTSFASVGKSDVEELKNPFPYYRYTMPSGKVYLAPYEPAEAVDTVLDGLLAMKEVNGDSVDTVIPRNVDFHVRMEGEVAVISFKEPFDVTAFEQNEVNQMIEGFMLTASGYRKQVQLENVIQASFGKYDLTKVLPMPIGSNPTLFTQ
ncbi:hypothetical protein [Sporosarcina sp. UB5]|uniref:hypothetical protein n=1 Tax=Sporosarcina sp. UB5 TaxID=3047463 RepID=UPI003D78B773